MAITYRAGTTATGTGNITLNKPAGVVSGDVMYAQIVGDVSTAASLTGWTSLGSDIVLGFALYAAITILRRVADGSEGASFTFATGASGLTKGTLDAFVGVDNTTPEDATIAGGTEGTVATVTFSNITTVTDNAWVLAFVTENVSSNTFTTPTGYTARGAANGLELFTKAITPAGVVTGATCTDSPTPFDWEQWVVALRPAGAVKSGGGAYDDRFRFRPSVFSGGGTSTLGTQRSPWPDDARDGGRRDTIDDKRSQS